MLNEDMKLRFANHGGLHIPSWIIRPSTKPEEIEIELQKQFIDLQIEDESNVADKHELIWKKARMSQKKIKTGGVMEKLAKLVNVLSPQEVEELRKINENRPPVPSPQTVKGCHLIPFFSADCAAYVYDKFDIKMGDVFVVSYPKTGTTWLAEVIRQLLYQEEEQADFMQALPNEFRFLELGGVEKFPIIDKLPLERRGFMTHLPARLINVEKIQQAKAKIVYVYRNPKDQIVSWWKFTQALPLPDNSPMKAFISSGWDKYFEHVVAGDFPMNLHRGEWYPDHILSWYPHRDNKTVYFMNYENMKKDLLHEVKLLAQFLEIPLTEEKAQSITEVCTFSNMKKLAQESRHAGNINRNLRQGVVGGWKDYFTVSQSERLDAMMEDKLKDTDIKFTYNL